jgi:creatinine amidohydrolase
MTASSDSLGHEILGQRLDLIPGILEEMLANGPRKLGAATLASERFIVTGTGSSEAHARYLATLLNLHTERAAAYLPLSGFVDSPPANFAGKTLIVFSQGVSPNAQIALQRRGDFAHSVLFSATTPKAAEQAGKPDRAQLLRNLQSAGAELVEFPLAEEYTTLIRFVGPMAGYLSALQFAGQFSESRVPLPDAKSLAPLLQAKAPKELRDAMRNLPSAFSGGFNLITAAPISDYSQNLACKFMEGLFWSCPGIRSVAMLRGVGACAYVLKVDAPPLLSIFGFEAALNDAVFTTMRHLRVDQVNWPGKGRDDLLYGFCPDN